MNFRGNSKNIEKKGTEILSSLEFKSGTNVRDKKVSRRRICNAFLNNLHYFFEGNLNFEEWELRQKELESQMSTEPQLPLIIFPSEKEDTIPEPSHWYSAGV